MPYIVVVKHDSGVAGLILTETKDAQKAIEQAKMDNEGRNMTGKRPMVDTFPTRGDSTRAILRGSHEHTTAFGSRPTFSCLSGLSPLSSMCRSRRSCG
jgi:hypothetical protein